MTWTSFLMLRMYLTYSPYFSICPCVRGEALRPFLFGWRLNQPMNIETYCLYIYTYTCIFILYSYYIVIYVVCLSTWTTSDPLLFIFCDYNHVILWLSVYLLSLSSICLALLFLLLILPLLFSSCLFLLVLYIVLYSYIYILVLYSYIYIY